MTLSPQDVELKQFARIFRGYDPEQVDEFLDQVEAELSRLLTENQELASRSRAERPAVPPAAEVATVPAAAVKPAESDEPQQAALRTLLMAQRTADQAIAEAREDAEKLMAEARRRVGQVDAEINTRTTAALAELEARRADLEVRIEDLRAFEREYRLRLKAYLETQLKDLDGRGGGGDEGLGAGVPAASRAAAVGVLTPGAAPSPAAQPAVAPAAAPAAQPAAAPVPAPAAAPAGPPLEAQALPAVGPFTPVPRPVSVADGEAAARTPVRAAVEVPSDAPAEAPAGPPREAEARSTQGEEVGRDGDAPSDPQP